MACLHHLATEANRCRASLVLLRRSRGEVVVQTRQSEDKTSEVVAGLGLHRSHYHSFDCLFAELMDVEALSFVPAKSRPNDVDHLS